eukprot:UN0451
MELRPDDGTERSTWCSMWQRLAGEQLDRALAWEEKRPPPGVLEWCSEEWRQATHHRRRFSLQSWHAWLAETIRGAHMNHSSIPLNDNWMGTLIPPLLAAVAAGCRGSVISAARKALSFQEREQLNSMTDKLRGESRSYRLTGVKRPEAARVTAHAGVAPTGENLRDDLDAWYCFNASDLDPFDSLFEEYGLTWVPVEYAPMDQ